MHQFDFGKQSWRSITTGGTLPNWSNVKAVMDYDTLVVYAFTDGRMLRLGGADKQNVANNPTHLDWLEASVNNQPFTVPKDYKATLSGTWINIYFFGIPGTKSGEVWGWRIHYGEWGPAPQSVGANFPNTGGKAATFSYKDPNVGTHNGAPNNIAFVPDDYSGLFIVDGYRNTTTTGPAPPKDQTSSLTTYIASNRYLVQFTPDTGALRFIDYGWLFNASGTQADSVWKEATVVSGLAKSPTTPAPAANGTSNASGTTSSRAAGATGTGGASAAAGSGGRERFGVGIGTLVGKTASQLIDVPGNSSSKDRTFSCLEIIGLRRERRIDSHFASKAAVWFHASLFRENEAAQKKDKPVKPVPNLGTMARREVLMRPTFGRKGLGHMWKSSMGRRVHLD
ncbi:hypothetical protein HK097_010112 [Rhizophlyctis rosea]|uniref:Uncharacterized protein n=1 Tax=Rhizophlyctis rosea TaxID=64517 RepID=A0AAD5WZZ2_9FUNG|nr:hypothetical protein HK097_010112 [Rhizophlyctis rosea]